MIAFMKYDLFPFCVWAEVISIDEKYTTVKSFGSYPNESVIGVFEDAQGNRMINKIQQIVAERDSALELINNGAEKKLANVFHNGSD